MTICKFFQQGYCKNGNNCRFEHINPNNNRFSAFGGGGGGGGGGGASNNRNAKELPFSLSKETIQLDLTSEKPQWILSSYGPGRDAPEQLFGGFPREQSFEEVRLVYEEGAAMGNPQAALSQIEGIYRNAENQIQTTLQNLDGAVDYIVSAQTKNPNRLSVVQNNTNGTFAVGRQQQTSNPFGAMAPNQPAPFGNPSGGLGGVGFGQPSALGPTSSPFQPSPFAQPAKPPGGFGMPSALGGGLNALGQPSTIGGPNSGFGQPSALGGVGFGQASNLGPKPSPFSTGAGMQQQPSAAAPAFGQPSQPASGFAQPTGMGGAPGFGQPAVIGQSTNPFGSAPTNNNPFGSTNTGGGHFGQGGNAGPFGQQPSGFGQATLLNGTFGPPPAQPSSAPEQSMDTSGPPATPATTQSPFGQPSAIGTGNPFGQAPQPSPAPFGQTPQNPFGQPPQSTAAASNPFGAPPQAPAAAAADGASPYAPGATRQHPPASSYITKGQDGTLNTFKGKGVSYENPRAGSADSAAFPATRNFDGTVTRIWNPNGPPAYYKDTEAAPEAYDAATRSAWAPFIQTGRFQNATIPEVPPLREWCTWDF